MTENELSLKVSYKNPDNWLPIALTCIGWYALGLLLVICSWSWLTQVPHSSLVKVVVDTLASLYVLPPFYIVGNKLKHTIIAIDTDGLLIHSLKIFGRNQQATWNQIQSLDMGGDKRLLIRLNSGSNLEIDSRALNAQDLEKVLSSIERFCPDANWSATSLAFRDDLQNSSAGYPLLTFTKMWDEELRRRFQSTTFVPHQPGTTLRSGDLTVVRQLSFGGFSAVYLVEDRTHNKKFVLKEHIVSSDDERIQDKAKEMFQREAKILATLNHNNVARILDCFVEQERSYLLIEYIEGENLRDFVLRNGPITEERVIFLALQMLDILGYLHDRQPPIIHRDFTPDNLVLSPSGTVTLVDFGTSNEFIAQATGTLVGKQSYMPIEQVRGKASPASDLYALGCTLYFMITGLDPQPLSPCQTNAEKHDVSPGLEAIILRLTQFEPQDRYADAGSVRKELEQLTMVETHEHSA